MRGLIEPERTAPDEKFEALMELARFDRNSLLREIEEAQQSQVSCLFGVICIERSEIIQVLLDDPIALARPLF